jgi:uncharacterized MAPEG superfamily protein
MTITSILIMCFLPYVLAGLAKFGGKGGFNNHVPRVALAKLTGWRQRANFAQANQFEALPLFIAGVVFATLHNAPVGLLNIILALIVIIRIVYSFLYITDKASLRSLVWLSGIILSISLFFI